MSITSADRVLLERPVALDLAPGAELVVHGAVRTSFDGTVFDAATRVDTLADGSTVARAGGLFDLEAGGLRVVAIDGKTHDVHLVATGAEAPACVALGIQGACLVPRTDVLAHERLMTRGEFVESLTGTLHADTRAPTPPSLARAYGNDIAAALIAGLFLLAAFFFVRTLRHRRASALGQVLVAAREAREAIGDDKHLLPLRLQIAPLVARAQELDDSRRAHERKLARIDRPKLEQRRARWARSTDPNAAETLAWINREIVEAGRLEQDQQAAVAGIARVESALRVLALNARSHQSVRARVAVDPVETAAQEIALREEAMREAEAVLGR